MDTESILRWMRSWAPIPTSGRKIQLIRWILLEGDRRAITGALLTVTFVTILAAGQIWPFEIRNLLTETQAVQTILNTFLGGIILLVSVVVSINSIVLSYDITSVTAQEDRIEAAVDFRQKLDELGEPSADPTEPSAFLQMMAERIRERAQALEAIAEEAEGEFARDVQEHIEKVTETTSNLERSLDRPHGGEFGVLWLGLETDYGSLINKSRNLLSRYQTRSETESTEEFEELIRAMELFAVGREVFKTLFYNQEIAEFSRTLLVVSLPSILITAISILAINANLLPDIWLFGLPPLLTFVAATFTVALAPFLTLTAYMLRVATVAQRTAGTGLFSLR
jgi:flagellin-specific chaperone FliS